MTSQLITLQEAALLANKSTQTIRRLIKANKIKHKRKRTAQGFNYYVDKKNIFEYFNLPIFTQNEDTLSEDLSSAPVNFNTANHEEKKMINNLKKEGALFPKNSGYSTLFSQNAYSIPPDQIKIINGENVVPETTGTPKDSYKVTPNVNQFKAGDFGMENVTENSPDTTLEELPEKQIDNSDIEEMNNIKNIEIISINQSSNFNHINKDNNNVNKRPDLLPENQPDESKVDEITRNQNADPNLINQTRNFDHINEGNNYDKKIPEPLPDNQIEEVKVNEIITNKNSEVNSINQTRDYNHIKHEINPINPGQEVLPSIPLNNSSIDKINGAKNSGTMLINQNTNLNHIDTANISDASSTNQTPENPLNVEENLSKNVVIDDAENSQAENQNDNSTVDLSKNDKGLDEIDCHDGTILQEEKSMSTNHGENLINQNINNEKETEMWKTILEKLINQQNEDKKNLYTLLIQSQERVKILEDTIKQLEAPKYQQEKRPWWKFW